MDNYFNFDEFSQAGVDGLKAASEKGVDVHGAFS